MDIAQYTQSKFAISDILRDASTKVHLRNPKELYPFEDLFARLAEDRFNIVVIGQFSRGKTSLMNAMLGTDRLPTGVVPLTSVITTVQYGPKEILRIEYEGERLIHQAPLDEIADYVSQVRNPGNEKHIKYARVDLPSELLRKGFVLADTPGLGSSIAANTTTTENFLPQADAFIMVTSYESPLSAEEYRILQTLKACRFRAFLVVNKRDLVSDQDRMTADQHIRQQVETIFGDQSPRLFSISAREAIDARNDTDAARYSRTGLPEFIDALAAFVLDEKQKEFLRHLITRVRARLEEAGDCLDEIKRLDALEQSLFGSTSPGPPLHFADTIRTLPGRFTACAVCAEVEKIAWNFLRQFQYDIAVDRQARARLAEAGGLCAFHTWQYAAIADTHGTCIAFPDVLDHFAALFSELLEKGTLPAKMKDWRPSEKTCVYCRRCFDAEAPALERVSNLIEQAGAERGYPPLCLPHLIRLANRISLSPSFVNAQLTTWRRVAEDMRRYALNRDAFRRAFSTADELDSNIRGLRLLAGHRSLSFPPPLDR